MRLRLLGRHMEIKQINSIEELKMGMDILAVDSGGSESLEKITCIDNGVIWTKDFVGQMESKEDLQTYLDHYKVFELK